jgi:Cu2+-containing amine oxidase
VSRKPQKKKRHPKPAITKSAPRRAKRVRASSLAEMKKAARAARRAAALAAADASGPPAIRPDQEAPPTGERRPDGTFAPGQSGNPTGRPKGLKDFVELCREVGSPVAFATLLADTDCEDPKPRQAMEVSGPGGGPVQTAQAPMPLDRLTEDELKTMQEIAKHVAERSATPAAAAPAPPSEPADVRAPDAG